jgi:hypothetical protein
MEVTHSEFGPHLLPPGEHVLPEDLRGTHLFPEDMSDALKAVGFDPGVPVYVTDYPLDLCSGVTAEVFSDALLGGTCEVPARFPLPCGLPGELAEGSMVIEHVEIIRDSEVLNATDERFPDSVAYCLSGYVWQSPPATLVRHEVKFVILRAAMDSPLSWEHCRLNSYVQVYTTASRADRNSRLVCVQYQREP